MKKEWKLGFNTFWWEGLDKLGKLRDCIKSLVEIGYDAVEFKIDSFGTENPRKAVIRAATRSPQSRTDCQQSCHTPRYWRAGDMPEKCV